MDKVELKVMGITYNPVQNGAYALLLREVNGQHRIPIVVGASEAHSIAVRLENMIPPRPLTHDLMTSMLHAYGISTLADIREKTPPITPPSAYSTP